MGVRVPPQSPPNGELPKASLAPKQNAQVTEEPLTCFPLCCLRLFPPPVHKPFQKRGEKGGDREQCSSPKPAVAARVPRQPCPALRCAAEREVGSAGPGPLARPRNYWFLPRLVPFIDSAVPSAGVTTGQTLFSPSFPAPFPASVYVVQSLSESTWSHGPPLKPATVRRGGHRGRVVQALWGPLS